MRYGVSSCVLVLGGGVVGVAGGTHMMGAVFLAHPTHLLMCLLAGAWALVTGMSIMVTGCSTCHQTPIFGTPNSSTFISSTPSSGISTTNTPNRRTRTPGTHTPAIPTPAIPTPGTPAPGTPAPGTPAPGTPTPGTPTPGTPTPGTPTPRTPTPRTPTHRTPIPGSPTSRISTTKTPVCDTLVCTPTTRRLLVVRLSLSSTVLVFTTVAVFLQLHHTGVYQWPRQTTHSQCQHSLLTSLAKEFNLRGVWVVTTSSIVGTVAALVSLTFSFSPCHQISNDSTCVNQVSILSSGWVYDPSPSRPRASEMHVEAKERMHCGQTYDRTSENEESTDPTLTLNVCHSRHHSHDLISKDSLYSIDSYGDTPSVADVSDDGVDVTRHLPMVRLFSFAPRTSSGGYTSNKPRSCENTPQLHLNQTSSRSSYPALKMGDNDTPVIREQYLRDVSPIPRVIIHTPTANQSHESPNPLMSNLTYSTPAETSSSTCQLSTPNNTQTEQYSHSQTLPYFSTDFRETFPHDMSVSESSWTENINVIYHGVQAALHSIHHDSPLSKDTTMATPPQKKSTSKAVTSTHQSSLKLKAVTFTHEQSEINIHPKHKSSRSLSEVVILTHRQNSGLPQPPPLGNSRKRSPALISRDYMCEGQAWRERGICPTGSCGKPAPPTRSCTTRITSTLHW